MPLIKIICNNGLYHTAHNDSWKIISAGTKKPAKCGFFVPIKAYYSTRSKLMTLEQQLSLDADQLVIG